MTLTSLLILPSPKTADHMGSYGPAFYQSYDASGQFTHEFDGEQIFSVDLKNGEVVWRLPEFGDTQYSNFQSGLASIAMIRAHLDILVERSNRTRAISGTWPSLCPTYLGSGGDWTGSSTPLQSPPVPSCPSRHHPRALLQVATWEDGSLNLGPRKARL